MTATCHRSNLLSAKRALPKDSKSRRLRAKTVTEVTKSLAYRLPSGAWDSHMHVVDPIRYPLAAGAVYQPSSHSLDDALAFQASLGIQKMVLVQPSIYGQDNTCLLDALERAGSHRARGVVVCDPKVTTHEQLSQWHRAGVRGIRLNYASDPITMSFETMRHALLENANMIRPFDWVLQIYLPMEAMSILEAIVPELDVRLCIDHMGKPTLGKSCEDDVLDPYQVPGFKSLMRILDKENTFIKLSAPYRIAQTSQQHMTDLVATELIKRKGMSKVVFATDWPHTRFEGLDITPWVEKVLNWTKDDLVLRERLFVKNAEDLWDGARGD